MSRVRTYFAARIGNDQLNVKLATLRERVNDYWCGLRYVVAAIAKVEGVARDRVDRIFVMRAAAIELNSQRLVAVIDVTGDHCDWGGID